MRRATSIIIGILLGAIAAGLGVGFFLKKANDDRERLAEQLASTSRDASTARQENQRSIEEANKKLLAANAEVGKAQGLIKALEEERDLLAQAKPLTSPAPRATAGWSDVIALDLGVSLRIPAGSAVESNDRNALTFVSAATNDADSRWFSLTPYDTRLEEELLTSLTTSTPISYLVHGHILTGVEGRFPGRKEPILVLRVRYAGEITHLLWVRNPNLNVLATMRFET